jgi:hypothetical protein
MKKLKLMSLLAIVFVCSSHEFWMNPNKFIFKKNEKATIFLQVGEDFVGERWKGTITRLSHFVQSREQQIPIRIDTAQRAFQMPLEQTGIHLIVLQNKPSRIVLEAEKFNAYLKEDGLLDILEYRKNTKSDTVAGREIYERCAKLLLKVEKNDKNYLQEANLPLEIIPLDNPFEPKNRLRLKIKFQNKPLRGHTIRFWQRTPKGLTKKEALTDAQGRVSFDLEAQGKIMISTVKMIPHENKQEADWHSYWASLVWGYEQ